MSIFSESEAQPPAAQVDSYETEALRQRVLRGSRWFYWIAALSLINSIILLGGGRLNFIIGLGVTQLIYGVMHVISRQDAGLKVFTLATLALDILVAGVFALFGFFGSKGNIPLLITGITLYVLDALLYLLLGDILAAGFHGLALFYMIRGLMAAFKLKAAVNNSPMMMRQ